MRYEILNMPIDVLSFDETLQRAMNAIETRSSTQHVAMNVAKLVHARRNDALRNDIVSSDIVGVDGMGIVWAARLLGIPIVERVPGVDLMERLLALCAARGYRPYFLGATRSNLEEAVARCKSRWPSLELAGFQDGYFDQKSESKVVEDIRVSHADCLFIGMPTPHKERFLSLYRNDLNVPFIMGVGGGIDILSNRVKRAPPALQKAGLEWCYRIYQEPKRMIGRYLITNIIFFGLLIREIFRVKN